MPDERWDADGDGRFATSGSAGQRGAESSNVTSGATPYAASPFATGSPFAGSPFDEGEDAASWHEGHDSLPTTTTAPVGWLGLACAAAVVGLLLALLTDQLAWHVVGWFLAGPAALGLLAVFTLKDTARRANPWYVVHAAGPWLYRGAVVLALAGVIACALRIALYFGYGGPL